MAILSVKTAFNAKNIICNMRITFKIVINFYELRIYIIENFNYFFFIQNKCCLRASMDTEMCCPKDKWECQYFILLT